MQVPQHDAYQTIALEDLGVEERSFRATVSLLSKRYLLYTGQLLSRFYINIAAF
jgi:hypothetical protein